MRAIYRLLAKFDLIEQPERIEAIEARVEAIEARVQAIEAARKQLQEAIASDPYLPPAGR